MNTPSRILGPDGNPVDLTGMHAPPASPATPGTNALKSSYTVKAFDPPSVNYSPTIAENALPGDVRSQHKLWRSIYNFDAVAGVAVELYGALPFGEFTLAGIEDPAILRVYRDAIENLNLENYFPVLATEFLVMGKLCLHLTFDKSKGTWVDMIDHDPDYVKIIPVPMINETPLVELIPGPELKLFANTLQRDRRLAQVRRKVSSKFIRDILSGKSIPLAESNTIYLPRRSSMQDYLGTSIYTRILGMVLYERVLLNGNIEAVHRRIGPLRIVTPSEHDQNPPEIAELEAYANALIQADRDSVTAYVAARRPLNIESLQPNEFIKLVDEWPIIQETKLKSLGMSEAFLTGDASVASLDMVLSVFLERVRTLRALFEQKILQEKVLGTLARVHGFVKRSKAELSHGIRDGKKARSEAGKKTSLTASYKGHSEFVLPEIRWENKLQPFMDRSYIDLLERVEGKGVPITIRDWSSAINLEIDKVLEKLDDDLNVRKKIKEWSEKKRAVGGGGDDEGSSFGASLREHPLYDESSGTFNGTAIKSIARVLADIKSHKAFDKDEAWTAICQKHEAEEASVKLALKHMGLPTPAINSDESTNLVSAAIHSCDSDKEFMRVCSQIRQTANLDGSGEFSPKALHTMLNSARFNGKSDFLTGMLSAGRSK